MYVDERESEDEVEREGGRRWQRGLGCAREQGSEWTKKGIGVEDREGKTRTRKKKEEDARKRGGGY